MGVGTLLLGIVVLVALVIAGGMLLDYMGGRSNREAIRAAQRETLESKTRERIATKALRAIANGAGSPILEATDALDQMERTYETKELN